MKKLGGYKLIDFGGVDISTSKTISGIYNEIEKTEKRIVGCNLVIDNVKFKELILDVKETDEGLELSNSLIKITITDEDGVVGVLYTSDNYSNKKIYYHPIYLRSSTSTLLELRICCAILNNDETPFTSDTFIAYIKELMDNGAIINANGVLQSDTNDFRSVIAILKASETVYNVLSYSNDSAMTGTTLDIYLNNITEFKDGVNAIN